MTFGAIKKKKKILLQLLGVPCEFNRHHSRANRWNKQETGSLCIPAQVWRLYSGRLHLFIFCHCVLCSQKTLLCLCYQRASPVVWRGFSRQHRERQRWKNMRRRVWSFGLNQEPMSCHEETSNSKVNHRLLEKQHVADVYTRCGNAAIAHFVVAMCRTNSNWFEFVRHIAATKFCHSDWFCHKNAPCHTRWHVAATCRRDVLQRPLRHHKQSKKYPVSQIVLK